MVWLIDHTIYTKVNIDLLKHIQHGIRVDLQYHLLNEIKTDDSTYTDYALLRLSIRQNQTRMSTYLIHYGCRLNSTVHFPFDSPLHEAINVKDYDIVELLLEKGASLKTLNQDNKTPLHAAADIGDYVIVNLILKHADQLFLDELKRDHQWSSLHIACAKNDVEGVIKLLEYTPATQINEVIGSTSPIWQGYTAMHVAVVSRHVMIIQTLLKYDIDLCLKDSMQNTALHLADALHERSIGSILLESQRMRFDDNPQNAQGFTHLHIACKIAGNKRNLLESFLDSGVADINAIITDQFTAYCGFTPLHMCVRYKFRGGVSLLLERGADLTIRNSRGNTPFDMAHQENDLKTIAMFLLEKRIFHRDVQKKSGIHNYLHDLGRYSNYNAIKDLVDKGVDPNGTNFDSTEDIGYTPLHFAVTSERGDMVKYLLNNSRTNINALNKQLETPLHLAVKFSFSDIVRMLLSSGASITEKNYENRTALEVSLTKKNYLITELLLSAVKEYFGVVSDLDPRWDLYRRSIKSQRQLDEKIVMSFNLCMKINAQQGVNNPHSLLSCIALHLALQKDISDMVSDLIYDGANVNYVNILGETPLHTYISNGGDSVATVCALLDAGANMNIQALNGRTILHIALREKKYNIVKLLVNRGANLQLQDKKGISGLHEIASYKGSFDNVKEKIIESLDSGRTVDLLTDRKVSPLYFAANYDCKEYVELLLRLGANPNQMSAKMEMPLHAACVNARPEIIKMLLDAGASVDAKDADGCLPLHLVSQNQAWRTYTNVHEEAILFFIKIFHYILQAAGNRFDIDVKDTRKSTTLRRAVDLDNRKCSEALIYSGANIELQLTVDRCLCGCLDEIMQKYMMRLQYLGLKPYLGATELAFKCVTTGFLEYMTKCHEELKQMEEHAIVDTLTLRDIITCAPSDMVRYAAYENVSMLADNNEVLTTYPMYGLILISRILCGQRMSFKTLNRAKYAVSVISHHVIERGLPEELAEHVLRFVGVADIHNLATALTKPQSNNIFDIYKGLK